MVALMTSADDAKKSIKVKTILIIASTIFAYFINPLSQQILIFFLIHFKF